MRKNRGHGRASCNVETLERRVLMTALPAGFQETVVAGGLGDTTAMDVLPDGRVLVSQQEGKLEIVPAGSTANATATTALTITVDSSGERGLLGVAHDPHFASNHFIYLYYTVPANGAAAAFNEVTRFTLNGNVADPASAVNILKLNDLGAAFHNGGSMHFGPDGKFYIGVGENTQRSNSQTLSNLLGKILRIDVSKSAPGDPVNDVTKLIPADNPFVGKASGINQAIYALGFRNPFTFAVNANGTIYINDVGLSTWEEIDLLKAGGNGGWGLSEGFNGHAPSGLGPGHYMDPLLAYNHSGGPAGGGSAIIGGVLYAAPAGAAHPFPASFNGKYFYADLGADWMRVFDPAHPGSKGNPDTSAGFATSIVNNPVGVAMAPDGGLYYVARGSGGELLKISFTGLPPMITRHPHAVRTETGENAIFTASAKGSGKLTYQWQRSENGGRFTGIVGAHSTTLTLKNVKLTDSGSRFRLVVRSAAGETVSKAVFLTVFPSIV